MLVLTRKEGQSIALDFGGTVAVVTVALIDGGKVKLGIDAPPAVAVVREEVAASSAVLAALDRK